MTKSWQSAFSVEDVEIAESKMLHQGFYKVQCYRLRHRTFNGSWSDWMFREQIYNRDAVAVLVYDIAKDKLIFVEQLRIGLLEHRADSPWLLEIVAGLVEPNESKESAVRREVQEETGCEVIDIQSILSFYNSPGGYAEKTDLFLATVDSQNASPYAGAHHENEDIRVHQFSAPQVLREWTSWLTSASTVIALQWFSEHYVHGKGIGKTIEA